MVTTDEQVKRTRAMHPEWFVHDRDVPMQITMSTTDPDSLLPVFSMFEIWKETHARLCLEKHDCHREGKADWTSSFDSNVTINGEIGPPLLTVVTTKNYESLLLVEFYSEGADYRDCKTFKDYLQNAASQSNNSGVKAECGNPSCRFMAAGVYEMKVQNCAACHSVSYCSKACQREHWKVHKKSCKPSSI